jgi:hypothetical protein
MATDSEKMSCVILNQFLTSPIRMYRRSETPNLKLTKSVHLIEYFG